MKDLGLRVLSLGIAILLAFFVQSDGNSSQASFVAPIQLQALPKGRVLVSPVRPEAEITVRGPSFLVSQLLASTRSVAITVPPDVEERYEVVLDKDRLNLPPSVQLVGVSPSEFEFRLEQVVTKTVPVEVPQLGRIAAELELVAMQIEPSTIVIQGPESEIASITRVESEPIDLRDVVKDELRTLQLRSPGRLVELSTRSISLAIVLRERMKERRISEVPVVVAPAELARQVQLSPPSVAVQLNGRIDVVRGVTRDSLQAKVQIPEQFTSGQSLTVTIDPPPGITIVDVEPSQVTVVLPKGSATRK